MLDSGRSAVRSARALTGTELRRAVQSARAVNEKRAMPVREHRHGANQSRLTRRQLWLGFNVPPRLHSLKKANTISRVALYARVSTLNGQDPEMQLRELREYASRRGWAVSKEYIDQGVSGSKESRPALNDLMADAHRRKFDAVLVWKIDRFGRSLKHLVNSLAELGALGVAFVSFR